MLPVLRPSGASSRPAHIPVVRSTAHFDATRAKGTLTQRFDGIDAIQNKATAGFNLEPPDEGLGAGNAYVVNFVNVTGGIYKPNGRMVIPPFYLNTFFGEPDAANTSDPRVFYDDATNRWFATILEYQFNADFTRISESHVDLAVSMSANPAGQWTQYQIPTSNPLHNGCPCLADYPILGIDAQNVYISTNEFTSDETGFNGAQLYAVSKSQLVSGASSPGMATFENLTVAGGPGFHVQPANEYGATSAEWLLSSLDPLGTSDNRIAVWAVTHEGTVTSGHGLPLLSVRVIRSETYAFPPDAQTPKGFCANCRNGNGAPTTGVLATDWDAMQETQVINGELVGALNTGLTIPGDTGVRAGAAWFVVHPKLIEGRVDSATRIDRQGYVAVQGQYLLYPHVNMTDNGAMAMTFGLGGPTTYPSAAYSIARPGKKFKTVKLAGAGTGPDNGFTATKQYGGVGRWGDYSNGEIIPGLNKVWMATQYIPNPGTGTSNWGNRIFRLELPS